MHQQEVLRISLQTNLIRNARRHRHGRNTGGTDERVDFVLAEAIHHLGHENARRRTATEGHHPQDQNPQRLHLQKRLGRQLRTHRQAQRNGDDIDQRVARRIGQTIHNAAFAQQVAESEHAHQGRRIRQQQANQNAEDQRENDFLRLADMAQLHHDDGTLFLGGQRTHDRRLYQRNQRHVGISRHGNRPQQFRRKLGGHEDRRRAVRTADDRDGGRLTQRELHSRDSQRSQRQRTEQGGEDTELGCRPEQQRLGVGQHRTEIGHCSDTHEDQQRKHAGRQADLIEQVQDASSLTHVRHRDVRQDAAETDRNQQQRLKTLADRQIDQPQADEDHQRLPGLEVIKTGSLPQLEQLIHATPLKRCSTSCRRPKPRRQP